jgi:hypothetical protein
MNRNRRNLRPLLLAAALCAAAPATPSLAQEIRLVPAADVVSRFIYRGIDLGDAPQIQPSLRLEVDRFQAALWGSTPIAPPADPVDGFTYRETVGWLSYSIDVGVGTLTPYVQNHYNPRGGRFFDFREAHRFQAQLGFVGADLPVDAMVGWVFLNDPYNSVYLEAGYRFHIQELPLRFWVGGTPARSPFNAAERAAVTNVGIAATYAVPITDQFALPLGVRFVLNPHTEESFSVFSVSF